MSFECEIKEQDRQPTLTIRSRTSAEEMPKLLGESYMAIGIFLAALGEQPAGPPYVAFYSLDMQNLDVEVGFPVTRDLPGQGNIQASELPEGLIATCMFVGPYSEMEPAYTALTEYVAEGGYEPTGVAYEFYLSDPAEVPPEESVTQIVFPLK